MTNYEIVAFTTVIVALLLLASGPWQAHVVDRSRAHLFALRDELFDLALNGEISFEDPRYRQLRQQINVLIRFAHKANFSFVLACNLGTPWILKKQAQDVFALDVDNMPIAADTGERMKQIGTKSLFVMIGLVFARSPLPWLYAAGLASYYSMIAFVPHRRPYAPIRTRITRQIADMLGRATSYP